MNIYFVFLHLYCHEQLNNSLGGHWRSTLIIDNIINNYMIYYIISRHSVCVYYKVDIIDKII